MHLSEPGCRNNPVELWKPRGHGSSESYGMRQDSGGAGEYRGGVGVQRTYHFKHDAAVLAIVKKTKSAPWGMYGGKNGEAGSITIWPDTERKRVNGSLHEKDLQAGDILINRSGGGGGWGNAKKRDPQRVLEDVVNGYVSLESARRDYGVAIDADTLTIDEVATAALRAN